ncbi:MAG: ABC transporter permease [Proteobacteria bacterium]|nr:ABC transporter permease [Pseudomonadota bacterium]
MRQLVRRRLTWFTTPGLIIVFGIVWHLYIVIFDISGFILPKPLGVVGSYFELLGDSRLWEATGVTVFESLVGFFFAAVIGIGGGAILGKTPWLEETARPFVIATQVVPKVALISLFILWFGFGSAPKILIATILAFFPILTNTLLGVKSVDLGHRDVMTSLNAGRWETFKTLEFPSALPSIIAGMEIGIVLAYIGAIVGEFLGGQSGLGFLTIDYQNAFDVSGLFGVIVQLTLVGFIMYLAIVVLRRVLIPWHESVIVEKMQQPVG